MKDGWNALRSLFLIHWSMFVILSEQGDTKYLFVWVDAQLVPMGTSARKGKCMRYDVGIVPCELI